MLKVINYFATKIEGNLYGDIYTNVTDLRIDHPTGEIIAGYGVLDTETGYSPDDAADWYWTFAEAEAFIKGRNHGFDDVLITIQAKAIFAEDGEVKEVHLFGASQSHPETVRDICQQVIDAAYGAINHHRIAVFTHSDWQNMRRDEPKSITVPVHTY